MRVTVYPPDYKMMVYEKQLAIREIETLFPNSTIVSYSPIVLEGIEERDLQKFKRLTFAKKVVTENEEIDVIQYILERDNTGKRRQNTRYSTHGIHEYKGKFNPQIVCSMLNISKMRVDSNVLDPFCGSGTTLLECAHRGISATGIDINPLATLIANTKLRSLSVDTKNARNSFEKMVQSFEKPDYEDSARVDYLKKWLPAETFDVIEFVKKYTEQLDEPLRNLIRIIVSNHIRDYSNQEPGDLRIRKRKTPLPEQPLWEAIREKFEYNLQKIDYYQHLGLPIKTHNRAICGDITNFSEKIGVFDCALTSPPYATALPYIDTQRISLVWLDLVDPKDIVLMESSLIGSREEKRVKKADRSESMDIMLNQLPNSVSELVREIADSLKPNDGFRKQATPFLLSRYFDSMRKMFLSVHDLIKEGGSFELIVGSNKSTIGNGFYIDTPKLLSDVAVDCGWELNELVPLQTYQRYGIHSKNAINEEKMIDLKRSQ